MPARQTAEPHGHTFRLGRAKDSPDEPLLLPADLAWLMSVSVGAVHARDAEIPHLVLVGPGGRRARRYRLADVREFFRTSSVGQAMAAMG